MILKFRKVTIFETVVQTLCHRTTFRLCWEGREAEKSQDQDQGFFQPPHISNHNRSYRINLIDKWRRIPDTRGVVFNQLIVTWIKHPKMHAPCSDLMGNQEIPLHMHSMTAPGCSSSQYSALVTLATPSCGKVKPFPSQHVAVQDSLISDA